MATSTSRDRAKQRKQLDAQVYAWNAKHRVGVFVNVTRDGGETQRTTTRGEAFVLEGHTAVISLTGISGVYSLDRVRAEKRDALDMTIHPDQLYYVQDSRTVNGDCMSWWCPDHAGYTANLDNAGTYRGHQVLGMRETDVPWPTEIVEKTAIRHVRWDHLRSAVESAKDVRPNLAPVLGTEGPCGCEEEPHTCAEEDAVSP